MKKNPFKGLTDKKKARIAIIALIFGGTIFSLSFVLFNPFVDESEATILLNAKTSIEQDFGLLLNDMKDSDLGELFTGKMPTPEEIFFSEWANDWFPPIDIPIYGPIIEEFGADMVGDINIDGVDPKADLNITSNSSPSDLNFMQCKALWDPKLRNSLVDENSKIWFEATSGNFDSQVTLQTRFNLTRSQLDLICAWINISSSGWMNNIANRNDLKPMFFTILIITGSTLTGIGLILLWSLRKRIKTLGLGIFKNKES